MAIALRARTPWEAFDLGCLLARHWAWPLWTVWCALFLPTAALAMLALQERLWIAALLLWWLLPLFDRFLLHVLARAVFGQPPTLAATLAAWREILAGGLWTSLLLRPFAWRRGFLAPVQQLEGQRGAAAQARQRVLIGQVGAHLLALALVCVGFELVVMVGSGGLLELLQPSGWLAGGEEQARAAGFHWGLRTTLLLVLALSLIEPLFVAAGFALYLSRRVQLEGWDIELGLRRLALPDAGKPPRRRATAAAALLAVLWLGTALPTPVARAADPAVEHQVADVDGEAEQTTYQPQDTAARQAITDVLAQPEFGVTREVEGWHRRKADDDSESEFDVDWLKSVGRVLGSVLKGLAWLTLAGLVISLIWNLARRWQPAPPTATAAVPDVLFGLAIGPQSLPDDIASAARRALAAGQLREALSLLYRGALSDLLHRRGLTIGEGATEGDVLRIAQRSLPASTADWFQRLLPEWIALAYGHRPPAAQCVQQLCDQYPAHFDAGVRAEVDA